MKRPIESDYTSHVAYTRALEAYCDSLAQPAQEPMHPQIQKMYEDYFDKCFREFVTEQLMQEPVAWLVEFESGEQELHFEPQSVGESCVPLCVQRPWVRLTDEEIQTIHDTYYRRMGPNEFARAIEQALKEKNT